MAIGGFPKSRNLLAQKRLQKRNSVRRILLESLEQRHLMAVGPQLLGIQPNAGSLLESGDVLNISPKELVFRFDDSAGIDPATLGGIRIIRSGDDGVFERASVATDFGSNGQTLVEFYAAEAGESGNGIRLTFSKLSRSDSRAPVVRVSGRTIDIEVNTNPNLLTRVEDILNAFDPATSTPATNLVYALRLRGSTTLPIAQTVDSARTYDLVGANAAKASTDFGLGNNVEVRLVSRESGNAGLGLSVTVTARDRGGAGNPIVTVLGKNINVELNSNSRFPTTIQEFVNAINASDSASSELIQAQLVSGVGATRIGASPITYSPILFSGVSDIEVVPGYVGLGDTDREVIFRFAEALPDDRYRIEILGQGVRTLRNVDGDAFNMGQSSSVAFELELGALVESVVPQPVSRNSAGVLTQRSNEIDVFFNDDDLIDVRSIVSVNGIPINEFRTLRAPLYFQLGDNIVFSAGASGSQGVLNPDFFQLFSTRNTLNTNDDVQFKPEAIRYYPDADRVTLTFRDNLESLRDPATDLPLAISELRLRIGTDEAKPLPPVPVNQAADPGDTFAGAQSLTTWTPGVAGSQSILLNSEIRNSPASPLALDFPGGPNEPGDREIRHQDNVRGGADSQNGTSIQYYNFKTNLGVVSVSNLQNAITEQQRVRVREVFSLYEQYLGVRFIESDTLGLTIGVGDMRAILPFEEIVGSGVPGVNELNGVGGTYYEAGTLRSDGSLATVLDIQDFSGSDLSEFAGPFQRAAMQAIGRLLGLGLADEVQGLAIQSFRSAFAPGVGTEIILPGDSDIVHGQYLYRPDSKDIDLYQFRVPVSGQIKIEAFAERMSQASLLDTQIRLYEQNAQGGWDEVAANDDYWSSDSYLQLDLEAGNYIVGVSASGNSDYDPTISDTGIGGRSEGNYQLRMDFQPPAAGVLRDGAGTPIDGDADGAPDGVFNFWFRPASTASTKFVDKSATTVGNGAIATPFRFIKDAVQAAQPGDVIRIVGNGGADGILGTTQDNLAYEIGFDTLGNALPDGSTFNVPRGVSVMIDAGAILKLRRARVGVGSTTVSVDRSGGSLLVLGTPKLVDASGGVLTNSAGNPVSGSVYFTSANDRLLGKNANLSVVGVNADSGDWGGLDFRNRIDVSQGREKHEVNGQFLNWVSHADVRFGGGQVVVDSSSQSINPISMVDARPAVVFSTITAGAEAAMGATPNSFSDTNFQSPREQGSASFTVDYDRVGPELHYNRITGNTINGLQIRVRTAGSQQLEQLTVQARFDDTDIVHFLPENLAIQGTPGGPVFRNNVAPGTPVSLVSRLDARLAIDPGAILKFQGSRIDVAFGSQLIAEGVDGLPVVFTSLNDNRHGAGGTFDTANRAATQAAAVGDWGGVYVGHTSKASLDYVVTAFGGGTTRIEGGFADFNALEVHQGDVRLTNSRIERNADGATISTDENRGGRGTNSPGAVFVRGAQPIIVGNTIINNAGPSITANVNALNHLSINDPGRSTGRMDRFEGSVGNRGPLVANNLLSDNDLNGMVVRGGVLTTEGNWDDTDIVHVVLDEITVPDFHVYGGLRLMSSSDQSLVVKLAGDDAGFTATGTPLDNADRIGGSILMVGQPGFPVILTSLSDSTVGAGFTLEGNVQTDTIDSELRDQLLPTGPEVNNGTLIDNDVAIGIPGQFAFDVGPGGSSNFGGRGGITAQGNTQLFSNLDVIFDFTNYIDVGGNGQGFDLATTTITTQPTLVSPDLVISEGNFAGPNGLVNWRVESRMDNGIAKVFNTVSFRSAAPLGSLQFINYLDEDVQGVSDDILYLTGTPGEEDFRAFTLDGPERIGFSQGGIYTPSPGELENATYEGWAADEFADLLIAIGGAGTTYTIAGNIDTNSLPQIVDPELGDIYGPADVTTAFAWRVNPLATSATITSFLELIPRNPATAANSGDWRSVLFDSYSNDRNVAATSETESSLSSSPLSNETASTAQFLGSLAPSIAGGDENQRLGFQVQAEISRPGDVDVYSFRADGGTEIWLDIDRTNNALDTVVELIDADGGILALSDDSLLEEATQSVFFDDTRMPAQSVNPLRKSSPTFYLESALGAPKDLYSTNPRDAGMRLRLPGASGENNLYHIRVRSGNSASTDPAVRLAALQDLSNVDGGLTKGSYQLQLRLTEVDEIPGSSITYADIRFARNGLQLVGVPGNSPLLGENGEVEVNANGVENDLITGAQALGNLLSTNRQALSVAGNLDDFTDVDWFSFVLDYQALTPTALREYFATVFDVDYADGIGRPDVSLYIFNEDGNLMLSGLGSNMIDDQSSPVGGTSYADLSRGSVGSLDPFIGSYELPVGTYFMAVTNSDRVPEVLATYTDPNSDNPLVRLQPIESVQLIAEDHVGFSGGSTALPPLIPVLFDPVQSTVNFNLSDVVLYVSQDVGQELTNIYMVNPFTGEVRNQVGRGPFDVQDIAFRPNGELRAFDRTREANVGGADRDGFLDYINIDPGTGQFTATPAPIQTFHIQTDAQGNITAVASDDGHNPEAVTFAVIGGQERGFMVTNRPTPPGELPSYSITRFIPGTAANPGPGFNRPGVTDYTNVIYEFDENNGQVTSAPAQDRPDPQNGFGTGTTIRERGRIETFTIDPLTGDIVTRATQLVSSEVTRANAGGAPSFLIRDGQTFSVVDGGGFVTRFEFNLGPEVIVNYDPVNGPTVSDGMQFVLDGQTYEFDLTSGTVGVSPGTIAIPLDANATLRQFVDAIADNVVGAVVSFDGGRMNFGGANTGNFVDLEAAGVFFDVGSSGAVAGGNIDVSVLASDTAETVAARIVKAVNETGIVSLNATANGPIVSFFGVSILDDGPLRSAGVAPGGIVTGATVIGNTMYAVSDGGGLYTVNNPTAVRTGNVASYVGSSYDLIGIEFSALVSGPGYTLGGDFNMTNLLFGLDTSGNLHAFDLAGRLQPVFANGASSVSTGIFNASGLALSTLDFNLWHVSGNESGAAGHGLPATPNDSRLATVGGGSSLYFGFEGPGANGVPSLNGANGTGLTNSYDFPGGAAGALESATFSLANISQGDLPMLYFSYRFETEEASSTLPLGTNADDYMRDALRVYVSGEDGQWVLVATNNAAGSNSLLDDEFDTLASGNPDVQPLFDNNANWRQARVPLELFAGQDNVKIRVEFSSAGGFGYGRPGGKGPEIRTISGDRLQDGETLTIEGQVFELEMGASVLLPTGAALNNGDSATIDGVHYVFTDGSTPVIAPDVPVAYTPDMSADAVANALRQAILANVAVPPTASGLVYNNESNDTLNVAESSGILGDSIEVIGSGQIGDNGDLTELGQDVDLVRVDLERGAQVTVQALAASIGSSLDTFLRVFDAQGRPLRDASGGLIQNDNIPGSTDSGLTFTAPAAGIYYVGVSGAGNQNYNAAVSGNATTGSTGNYRLSITVRREVVPIVDGNRLQLEGAGQVTVTPGSALTVQGSLGTTGVPIYVNVGMNRAQVAAALSQGIASHFANGVAAAYPVRGGDTVELTGLSSFGLDGGPFGLTTNFVGDAFGAFNTGTNFDGSTNNANPGALGAQDNDYEGVYLDDFIIGIAGRGEMVLNVEGGNTNFIEDPQKQIPNPDQFNPEILVGPYQLEVRGGDEYGVPDLVGIEVVDTIAIDSRQSPGFSIEFNRPSSLIAGSTFTVGDGTRVLTFEMDDVNDAIDVDPANIALQYNTALVDPVTGFVRSETAGELAARFRDLINSTFIQEQLEVTANLLNNDRLGTSSETVALFGNASVEVPATIGQVIVSDGKSDSNRQRPQGQVVINSVRVSNSAEFGALIANAPRQTDANNPLLNTNAPVPGTPRNTVTLNVDRLAPGAAIMNSEFISNRAGGISVAGDPTTTGVPAAAVPFVRLVNNTILGGTVTTVSGFVPTIHGGDVFEIGNLAFADRLVSYSPLQSGGPGPIAGLDVGSDALGVPNYSGNGEPLPGEGAVSLGRGGQIVLQFTNNLLTGSGDANPDLRIFEVGDSEEVLVEVSADGTRYTAVGRASAASPRVDIDAFGFNTSSRIAFVRLTDIAGQGSQTGNSVGADIDSVGALSSVAVDDYSPGGTGISVTSNGTATLLNNVVVNSSVGINVDASSTSTIVAGSVFQRNVANVSGSASLGQNSLVLDNNVPVFVSAGTGNLYPAPSSPLIDSSIDSLQDRPSLVAVKVPLGLSASPMLAPQFDIHGQLRVDDPSVETPSGLGENVFKDRGAQDRADFVGPSVVLKNPVDNDLAGLDANPQVSIVELSGVSPRFFDIQLFDGLEPSDPSRGTGVDHATVNSESVLVYRNDVPLVEGVDYRFGYDSTNGVIRLQPLAGIWRSESVYTIRFLNSREAAIVARSASLYTDGEQFEIMDATGSLTSFEFDTGYVLNVPTSNGIDADLFDGTTFTLDDGVRRLTFEMDRDGSVTAGNQRVNLGTSPTVESGARAIETAIENAGMNLDVTEVGPGQLQIQGSRLSVFDVNNTGLTVSGQPGVQTVFGLQIPLAAGRPVGLADGQTFTIDRSGSPVRFELDTNGVTLPGNVPVRYFPNAGAADIGAALVLAINGAALGLSPSYDGDGLVRLGGDSNTRLDLTDTALLQAGIAGQPAAVAIELPADASANDVATLIKSAIDSAGLSGVTVTQFGGRLVVEGAQGVGGVGAGQVQAIRDLAGNTLKPNQVDGSTTLMIFLGEGVDYGDAPAPYLSTNSQNGPRHKVVAGLTLGATISPDADARLPDADNDDGIVFTSGVVAAFQSNAQVSVTNTTGQSAYLSMWIDYNGDGTFSQSERILSSQLVNQPIVNLSFLVPPSAMTGTTFSRIRLSSDAAAIATPLGAAPDGEVEDFAINIQGNPYTNQVWNLDVNGDSFVSPIDVLQVINWINDPTKPQFLTLADATGNPPFVDVNGDGIVSGNDVLLVVNYLNSLPAAGEGEGVDGLLGLGNFSDWSAPETVLASDWAPGIESMLLNDRQPRRLTPSHPSDLAFMDSDDTDLLAGGHQGVRREVTVSDSIWAEWASSDGDDNSDHALQAELLVDLLGE